MRAHRVVMLVVSAVLAAAAPARAQAPECAIDPGPAAYQAALLPAMPGVQAAARSVLGSQYAGIWFKTSRQGVDIGVAPGPLDLAGAQGAVLAALPPDVAAHVFVV